jgi:hypothetical protein
MRGHPKGDGDHDAENAGSGKHDLSPLFVAIANR